MRTKTSAEAGARNRTLSRAVIAGGSAMALGGMSLAMGAAPAEATHDHDHISGILNSPSWRVCRDDTPTALGNQALNWATAVYDSHSDLGVVQQGQGGACPNPNVFFYDESFPEPFDNQTLCFFWDDPGVTCHVKITVMNTGRLNLAANPASQWKKAACQGFGRVAGLGNRFTTASCMTEGGSPPIATIPDAHDANAVALTY
jgi:hypothetical protein